MECHIAISNISKLRKTSMENREQWVKQKYGITQLEYNKMLVGQNGLCEICGVSQLDLEKVMAIDHDHKDGKIRDLLCDLCNQGLGDFKDNIDLLSKAIEYLNKHNNKKENKSS